MADRRAGGIAWTDETWNPLRGCSRVSEGCRHCYAESQALRITRMDRGRGIPVGQGSYDGLVREVAGEASWTSVVRLASELLAAPLHWRRPRRVFVNSMSDLFHESLSDGQIAAVFGVMAAAQQHTFQVLTKRPRRMIAWFKWVEAWRPALSAALVRAGGAWPGSQGQSAEAVLCEYYARAAVEAGVASGVQIPVPLWPLPNVWLGVSVEDQRTADERIPLLLQTPAAVRWVSYEPALGPADFACFLWPVHDRWPGRFPSAAHARAAGATVTRHRQALVSAYARFLDWIVFGGESGPQARPCNLAWARSTRDQCREAGAAFFMKQAGSVWARSQWDDGRKWNRAGADPSEWPEDLRVHEFPAQHRVDAFVRANAQADPRAESAS